jgi:pimeloyl-ACP methyl ester carboxylesterase
MYSPVFITTALLPLANFVGCLSAGAPAHETSVFNWGHVKPSRDLMFHPCYDDLQCARLLLPLDWLADEEDLWNETVALAVVKVPADVPPADPAYGGTILAQPGGSGVEFLNYAGQHLKNVVDSSSSHSEGKSFDILSFDPRGVLHSTPSAVCFPDGSSRATWRVESQAYGLLDSAPQALNIHKTRANVLGAMCASREDPMYYEPEKIRGYMGSTSTARDILEILERLEDYRHSLVARSSPIMNKQSLLSQGIERKSPKLQYWGFSYGTFLGNTFASMYPDRVGRMVLDGVLNAPDYVATGWSTNLQDTEKVVRLFYQTCYEAGPSECPLYNEAGPEAMELDVRNLLENLRDYPIAAIVQPDDTTEVYPGVITYRDIKTLIFTALSNPIGTFPALATMLAGLKTGNYQEILGQLAIEKRQQCGDRNSNGNDRSETNEMNEILPAIFCGDGEDITNRTAEDFKSYLRLLESQSPTAGSIFAMTVLQCMSWRIRAKWRFTGPFKGNTSTPILWIGNTADPVTPVRNAHEMAKGFPGSVVLTQDAGGHCSGAAPSICTMELLRRYFADGTLPREGMVCPTDFKPFHRIGKTREIAGRGLFNFNMATGLGWRR